MCPSFALSLALISGIQPPVPGVPSEVVSAVSGGCQDCRFKSLVGMFVSADLFERSVVFLGILSQPTPQSCSDTKKLKQVNVSGAEESSLRFCVNQDRLTDLSDPIFFFTMKMLSVFVGLLGNRKRQTN